MFPATALEGIPVEAAGSTQSSAQNDDLRIEDVDQKCCADSERFAGGIQDFNGVLIPGGRCAKNSLAVPNRCCPLGLGKALRDGWSGCIFLQYGAQSRPASPAHRAQWAAGHGDRVPIGTF